MLDKFERVERWLSSAQEEFLDIILDLDKTTTIDDDKWSSDRGSYGRTLIFEKGKLVEKFAVNFSSIKGDKLPPSATDKRPDLSGKPFRAVGLSIVYHPANPFVPTAHENLRFFYSELNGNDVWWWRWF